MLDAMVSNARRGTSSDGSDDQPIPLAFEQLPEEEVADEDRVRAPSVAEDVLAPYLVPQPGLSSDAYEEWVRRVAAQPDDRND